jgi:hypothetical protein
VPRVHIGARTTAVPSHYRPWERIQESHQSLLEGHLPHYGFSGKISWVKAAATIAAEYDADRNAGDGPMLAAANTALQLVQQVGLGIVEATVTDTISAWGATGPVGAAGGLTLTKDAGLGAQVVGLIVGGIVAGLIGLLIRIEVPVYRLTTDQFGRWVWTAVPPRTAAPLGVSLAPTT